MKSCDEMLKAGNIISQREPPFPSFLPTLQKLAERVE
jgi:hypothetical protein